MRGKKLWFGAFVEVSGTLRQAQKQPREFTYLGDAFLLQQYPPQKTTIWGRNEPPCPKKGVFHPKFLAGRGGLAACTPLQNEKARKSKRKASKKREGKAKKGERKGKKKARESKKGKQKQKKARKSEKKKQGKAKKAGRSQI